MQHPLSLEEFYEKALNGVPDNLHSGPGHFNVFQLDEFASAKPRPMPFNRRDYFKISLVKGRARVHYADRVIRVEEQVLVFSNPQIPYNWEKIDENLTGFFCIFTRGFINHHSGIPDYPIFQPKGDHVFVLSNEQARDFELVFGKMFDEIASDYAYKYDVLRNLTYDLVHGAMKLKPAQLAVETHSNASERIISLFMELLERQFPIENLNQRFQLRTAADFADKLNIHVNHLNRTLKSALSKTTSELINDRLIQEAKILLLHSNWNVSEISYSLGFEEIAHFSNFFKRHTGTSPASFRKSLVV